MVEQWPVAENAAGSISARNEYCIAYRYLFRVWVFVHDDCMFVIGTVIYVTGVKRNGLCLKKLSLALTLKQNFESKYSHHSTDRMNLYGSGVAAV